MITINFIEAEYVAGLDLCTPHMYKYIRGMLQV